jgi:hypothetical protein
MDFRAIGCDDVNWIYLLQDSDQEYTAANTVIKFFVP